MNTTTQKVGLTIDQVNEKVREIRGAQKDYERAHILEDQLYLDFVAHVYTSSDDEELSAMARQVLVTRSINFPRRCS